MGALCGCATLTRANWPFGGSVLLVLSSLCSVTVSTPIFSSHMLLIDNVWEEWIGVGTRSVVLCSSRTQTLPARRLRRPLTSVVLRRSSRHAIRVDTGLVNQTWGTLMLRTASLKASSLYERGLVLYSYQVLIFFLLYIFCEKMKLAVETYSQSNH